MAKKLKEYDCMYRKEFVARLSNKLMSDEETADEITTAFLSVLEDGDMYFTNGVAEFTLKHGQSATALNLPEGIIYTVTESEANQDGYTTSSSGTTGTIPNGGTAKAEFVNDKNDDTPPPPDNPPDDTPKTGDDSHLGFWLAMMLISMAGVIVTSVSLFGKRRFVSYHGKHFKK